MTGRDDSFLREWQFEDGQTIRSHPEVTPLLQQLMRAAQDAGLAIKIVSGYRSFKRQLSIWNEKWQGYRPVYSRHGRPLHMNHLSPIEKYKAIALYSALPGMSRHHWGTDFDIFLKSPIDNGYEVQLEEAEFSPQGPCHQLETWLGDELAKYGFFRPYQHYRGGVAAEPWHISAVSVSAQIYRDFELAAVKQTLLDSPICDGEWIINQLEHYKENFFNNICPPAAEVS